MRGARGPPRGLVRLFSARTCVRTRARVHGAGRSRAGPGGGSVPPVEDGAGEARCSAVHAQMSGSCAAAEVIDFIPSSYVIAIASSVHFVETGTLRPPPPHGRSIGPTSCLRGEALPCVALLCLAMPCVSRQAPSSSSSSVSNRRPPLFARRRASAAHRLGSACHAGRPAGWGPGELPRALKLWLVVCMHAIALTRVELDGGAARTDAVGTGQ